MPFEFNPNNTCDVWHTNSPEEVNTDDPHQEGLPCRLLKQYISYQKDTNNGGSGNTANSFLVRLQISPELTPQDYTDSSAIGPVMRIGIRGEDYHQIYNIQLTPIIEEGDLICWYAVGSVHVFYYPRGTT